MEGTAAWRVPRNNDGNDTHDSETVNAMYGCICRGVFQQEGLKTAFNTTFEDFSPMQMKAEYCAYCSAVLGGVDVGGATKARTLNSSLSEIFRKRGETRPASPRPDEQCAKQLHLVIRPA